MTRDELRKRIKIILNNYSIGYDLDHINANKLRVDHILNTIFDALQVPTEEMVTAAFEAEEDDCIWQAMLNASPLAKEE